MHYFLLSTCARLQIIYTRLLQHPWRVRQRAQATVWVLPGWEMCNLSDWRNKGECYQSITNYMNQEVLQPAKHQVVAVATTSRPNSWAMRYQFLWNNSYWKLANENFCVWQTCPNDFWVPVPKASSYLVPTPAHPPRSAHPHIHSLVRIRPGHTTSRTHARARTNTHTVVNIRTL